MTPGERRFCTVSLIWGIVYSLLVPIATIGIMTHGTVQPDFAPYVPVFMALYQLVGVGIIVFARMNMKADQLRPGITVLLLIALVLSGYGIPLAVWGYILIRRRRAARLDTDESNYQRSREDEDA